MGATGAVIFLATYVLISTRRLTWLPLDRPAAALAGAVACVALGVLTPGEAMAAIDGATLLLLLGVMGLGAFLAVDGVFERIEGRAVALARTPARLLGLLVWTSGLSAALVTNDAVCLLLAPVVVRLVVRHRLPPLPFLLALATSANTGSVATLVGNPQNMLCALLGGLAYRDHLLLVGPVALVSLAVNHAMLLVMFRRDLADARLGAPAPEVPLSRGAPVTLLVIAGTAVAFTAGADLAWTAIGAFVLLMVVHRRDTRRLWPEIDGTILLFFAGLFVVVAGLQESGVPDALFARFPLALPDGGLAGHLRLAGIFLAGSNVVSNVPFILVVRDQMAGLPDPRLAWELLAVASTFAGNMTLVGSVANIIVAEAAREIGGIGFREHLRVGLPLAVVTTLLGALWLYAAG